jgi:murein DD-endopeptidase MepM/ murein hydrolase activator NlpD
VVALAEELRIRGNATLIDHGHGVYTGYWHQLGLDVTLGQRVQAGEVIGRVGDSGLSTGTHLHWEVWVNAIQVDPMEWLQVEIP